MLKTKGTYSLRIISSNHGKKNKSVETGKWVLKDDLLILNQTPVDGKALVRRYKVVKGDLWSYSFETNEAIELVMSALKK